MQISRGGSPGYDEMERREYDRLSQSIKDMIISREQLDEMFATMRARTRWDVNGPLLWSYYFTARTSVPLERASLHFSEQGYRCMPIYAARDGITLVLRIERVERHTPDSLDRKNGKLEQLAKTFGADSYDGMDVGLVPTDRTSLGASTTACSGQVPAGRWEQLECRYFFDVASRTLGDYFLGQGFALKRTEIGGLLYVRWDTYAEIGYEPETFPNYAVTVVVGFGESTYDERGAFTGVPAWYVIPEDQPAYKYSLWGFNSENRLEIVLRRIQSDVLEAFMRPLWTRTELLEDAINRFRADPKLREDRIWPMVEQLGNS